MTDAMQRFRLLDHEGNELGIVEIPNPVLRVVTPADTTIDLPLSAEQAVEARHALSGSELGSRSLREVIAEAFHAAPRLVVT